VFYSLHKAKHLPLLLLECHFVTSTVKKIPQIPHNAKTNFKLQDVKQSEDTEDETGAVF
jgi:hypothetical protein